MASSRPRELSRAIEAISLRLALLSFNTFSKTLAARCFLRFSPVRQHEIHPAFFNFRPGQKVGPLAGPSPPPRPSQSSSLTRLRREGGIEATSRHPVPKVIEVLRLPSPPASPSPARHETLALPNMCWPMSARSFPTRLLASTHSLPVSERGPRRQQSVLIHGKAHKRPKCLAQVH